MAACKAIQNPIAGTDDRAAGREETRTVSDTQKNTSTEISAQSLPNELVLAITELLAARSLKETLLTMMKASRAFYFLGLPSLLREVSCREVCAGTKGDGLSQRRSQKQQVCTRQKPVC
jgi:hypothetical protein